MWNQANLFGEKLEIPNEEKLKEVCCESCYTAKEEKCTCKCNGAFHGLGSLNNKNKKLPHAKIDATYEKALPEEEAKEFRKHFGSDNRRTHCLCGYDLREEPIVYYVPHSDGWTVKCESEKVWLYVKCPKCGYDMSVWKMGVPRE